MKYTEDEVTVLQCNDSLQSSLHEVDLDILVRPESIMDISTCDEGEVAYCIPEIEVQSKPHIKGLEPSR